MCYCEKMGKKWGIDLNKIKIFYFFAKKRKDFCNYLLSRNNFKLYLTYENNRMDCSFNLSEF